MATLVVAAVWNKGDMTALWISLALAVVLGLAVWRLRRANRLLNQILDEERERAEGTAPEADDDVATDDPDPTTRQARHRHQ